MDSFSLTYRNINALGIQMQLIFSLDPPIVIFLANPLILNSVPGFLTSP